MMIIIRAILYLLIMTTIFIACSKHINNSCISFEPAPITAFSAPDTALVNQDIPLTVSFGIFSGCGQFENIQQTINGDTVSLVVNTKYEGCVCTAIAGTLQAVYTSRFTQTGTWYFKLMQENKNYFLDSVVIR